MLTLTNPIDQILDHIHKQFKQDPNLERKIQVTLEKLVRLVYQDSITQTASWCATLKTPENAVLGLLDLINLDKQNMINAFMTQFNLKPTFHMWGNPYYHVLLLFVGYGIHFNNMDMARSATTLLFVRVWNGRRLKYIPYCDISTMRYVVANLSKKSLFKTYDGPMSMIMNYYTPSMLQTYSHRITTTTDLIKRFYDQIWARIDQLFVQNMSPDLKTGEIRARSGIAPLYYAAKDAGLKIASSKMRQDSEDDISVADIYSSGEYDELIEAVENYIVMNLYPKYEDSFVKFLCDELHLPTEGAKIILNSLHSIKYEKHIQEILGLLLKQIQLTNELDVCKPDFLTDLVKRKVVSSKHTAYVTQLKAISDDLLEKIFTDKIKYKPYAEYSSPRRGQLRNIMIYAIAYNLQKYVCSRKKG